MSKNSFFSSLPETFVDRGSPAFDACAAERSVLMT